MQEKCPQIRRLENKNLQLVRMNQTLENELDRLRHALNTADDTNATMDEIITELERKLSILYRIIELDNVE